MKHRSTHIWFIVSAAAIFNLASSSCCDAAAPEGVVDAVDGVIAAFKRHRIVAVGELHGVEESHETMRRILSDARLPGRVRDIVVEFGSADAQMIVNRFIDGERVEEKELRAVWRNTINVFTWDSPIYRQLLQHIRDINAQLPAEERFRVWLGDPPVGWPSIKTATALVQAVGKHKSRDHHCATLIEAKILARNRSALVFYGAHHVRRGDPALVDPKNKPVEEETLVEILERRYPGQVFSVYPIPNMSQAFRRATTTWPVDTFVEANHPRLVERTYDELIRTPKRYRYSDGKRIELTGDDSSVWPKASEVFDAYLHLGHASELTFRLPTKAIYEDPEYSGELRRRVRILFEMVGGSEENMKSFYESGTGQDF